jgi:hypothetical protein
MFDFLLIILILLVLILDCYAQVDIFLDFQIKYHKTNSLLILLHYFLLLMLPIALLIVNLSCSILNYSELIRFFFTMKYDKINRYS